MSRLGQRGACGRAVVLALVAACAAGALPACAASARRCQLEGNRATLDGEVSSAPVVVLMEHNNATDVRGTFSLWADGSMVFEPYLADVSHARTATRTPAVAEEVRASLVALLAGRAPYLHLGLQDPATGSRMVPAHFDQTTLLVRDGEGWLVARVRGVGRDDVLDPDPPPTPPSPRATGSLGILNYLPEPAPPWFHDAFLVALRAIPDGVTAGAPFDPSRYRGKSTVRALTRCVREHAPQP